MFSQLSVIDSVYEPDNQIDSLSRALHILISKFSSTFWESPYEPYVTQSVYEPDRL